MAEPRKRLTDILRNGERERLEKNWSMTKPADDLKPIPAGYYRCRLLSGELFNAKTGTPGFKLSLEVIEGEHARRRLWYDIWLSEAALPIAKRDLAKLGIDGFEQLERPLTDGMIVKARIALRRNDDRIEYNRVDRFDVETVEPPAPEPFAPREQVEGANTALDSADADGFDWATGAPTNGRATP
jgi:hypothetical protein